MQLQCMVIADPNVMAAQDIADDCEPLAEKRVVHQSGADALKSVRVLNPEIAILSLELRDPVGLDVITKVVQSAPGTYVVVTYRELSIPVMQKLMDEGVETFVPQPVDVTHIYRAASTRFHQYFRRYERYFLGQDVYRVDRVMIGKSIDISEGGMRVRLSHPVNRGESVLLDVELPDSREPLRVRCLVLSVDGQAPTPMEARLQFEKLLGKERQRLAAFLRAQKKAS